MASSNNRDSNETDKTTSVLQKMMLPEGQSYEIEENKMGEKWFCAAGTKLSAFEVL